MSPLLLQQKVGVVGVTGKERRWIDESLLCARAVRVHCQAQTAERGTARAIEGGSVAYSPRERGAGSAGSLFEDTRIAARFGLRIAGELGTIADVRCF